MTKVEVHGFFKVKVGIAMVQGVVTSLDSSPIYNGAKDYTGQIYQLRMERMGLNRSSLMTAFLELENALQVKTDKCRLLNQAQFLKLTFASKLNT
ncbi:hypothetical protein PPACK8108_LOCUS15965 [Phakopsora pachyrhizi]|uniref:Uncharacterized protein n=1 Tax=Phakopsora pachyrhizi TaxID=170000 RepID=A0AAV0B9L7_PHAPC|nr:hypothetical protein PPACK8108_LOCUS15965 [Phakopsora pachyrhizi]